MAQPTRELLTHFDGLHLQRLGERAVIQGGKDAKLLASLSASHGPERVKELMTLFFQCDDDFVLNAGYTVGVFISQAGKLIARDRLSKPKPSQDADWFEQCQQLHAGACGGRAAHAGKMGRDAIRLVS